MVVEKIREKYFNPYYPGQDPKADTLVAVFHTSPQSRFEPKGYRRGHISKAISKEKSGPQRNNLALVSKKDSYRPVPEEITDTTRPPRNKHEAMKYPDVQQWLRAIDLELDKLDKRGTISWMKGPLPKVIKAILFTCAFEYKVKGALLENC